jgi:hypothetical protein
MLMAHDKNVPPVGWYVGSYLLRFIELDDKERNNPDKRFTSWENTVVVQASSLDVAYSKVERIAKQNSKPYRGGPAGVRVQWEYLGVTELLPIYEELGDGAEISWSERAPRKLKSLNRWVKSKKALRQ